MKNRNLQSEQSEHDAMKWLTDLPDRYILEAGQTWQMKKKKGALIMHRISYVAAGTAAAVLLISGIGIMRWTQNSNTPEHGAEIQTLGPETEVSDETKSDPGFETEAAPTGGYVDTESFAIDDKNYEWVGWIRWKEGLEPWEGMKDYLYGKVLVSDTCFEPVAEFDRDALRSAYPYHFPGNDRYIVFDFCPDSSEPIENHLFMLYEETEQKGASVKLPLQDISAYYGMIAKKTDNALLIEGLEINDINHRGENWYSKDDIAEVTGYVTEEGKDGQRDSYAMLKEGDRVCVIESGVVAETYPGQFSGIAKIMVIGHDSEYEHKE